MTRPEPTTCEHCCATIGVYSVYGILRVIVKCRKCSTEFLYKQDPDNHCSALVWRFLINPEWVLDVPADRVEPLTEPFRHRLIQPTMDPESARIIDEHDFAQTASQEVTRP